MATNKQVIKPLHIAMYPWFAHSHHTSFLRLANKLAQRGHQISFFLPPKAQPKLVPHNHRPNLITFIPIPVPSVDGLPAGSETTNDTPPWAWSDLMTSMDLTRPVIDSHMARLKPDLVFFDLACWVPDLARKHRAKSLYYGTSNLARFAYFLPLGRNLPVNHRYSEDELMEPPLGFPSQGKGIRLRAYEARSLATAGQTEFGGGMTFCERMSTSIKECDALVVKTCDEMEGPYRKFFEECLGKPILLAGPLVPEPLATTLDEELDGWLKGFGEGSVVYCALGSECVLEKDPFQELVLGLELTGRPFLAALKPPKGYEMIESALPPGFTERTNGRGKICGWVQQPLILEHPSIGCFVTHCGAGSLSEAILSKCQLVLFPQATDQFVNAKMMSMELRVGVEVERRENDGYFTREGVARAISTVTMEVESSGAGREMRDNHAKWRELLLKDGFEGMYISKFIESLRDLFG